MTLRFGTDGIRGRAYDELTVPAVEALAVAAGTVLGGPAMVIGADPRESGPDFVAAMCRGLAHAGIEPWLVGVAPTPVVAHAAAVHDIPGAMVSASHNPYHDNGVKFFAAGGRKLTDAQQAALEAELAALGDLGELADPTPVDRSDLGRDYLDWLRSTLGGRRLDGVDVIVDCANGAASELAPRLLADLGARVTSLHDQPDGRNINDRSGSTDMSSLRAAVVERGAQLGLAFDGDADRVLAVDERGQMVDGDHIIGICAIDRHRRGELVDDTVVVTVMTNLGFHQGMAAHGIAVHQTPVGDRNVLEALEKNQWSLGGEQSGHVIFHDIATTGDGLLTAIQLLDVVVRRGRSLAEMARDTLTRLPQVLRNVQVSGSADDAMAAAGPEIARVEAALGSRGRLLVRPSGTVPLFWVMAVAPTEAEAEAAVDGLVEVFRAAT